MSEEIFTFEFNYRLDGIEKPLVLRIEATSKEQAKELLKPLLFINPVGVSKLIAERCEQCEHAKYYVDVDAYEKESGINLRELKPPPSYVN